MAKKRGLGKGLEALIPPIAPPRPASSEVQAGAIEIPIARISPNPHQPRQTIDQEKLQELANSILEHGLIQPLIVTQVGTAYQLIVGERRWRASQLAGLTTAPAIVKETQAVAERVGKSRTAVANTVRLLNLPEEIKANLAAGKISEGHARALLSFKKQGDQLNALVTIVKQGLNVRQTEALVRRLLSGDEATRANSPPQRQSLSALDKSMLARFETRLGTKVELSRTAGETGKITIHFYSQEELQAIFNAILAENERL
jgi:ParB family chromosome partitioning protein